MYSFLLEHDRMMKFVSSLVQRFSLCALWFSISAFILSSVFFRSQGQVSISCGSTNVYWTECHDLLYYIRCSRAHAQWSDVTFKWRRKQCRWARFQLRPGSVSETGWAIIHLPDECLFDGSHIINYAEGFLQVISIVFKWFAGYQRPCLCAKQHPQLWLSILYHAWCICNFRWRSRDVFRSTELTYCWTWVDRLTIKPNWKYKGKTGAKAILLL